MNITPISIHLVDFLSHEDTKLVFSQGNHFVTGENLDDPEMPNNGTGKTGIPNALLYVFTGKTFDGAKGNSTIREGCKSSQVTFRFLRSDGRKGYISVRRNPNSVLFHNGVKQVKAHSKLEMFKKIQKFFGIDFEILTKFIIVGEQERYKFSFLGSDDSEKKNLLTKLTSSSIVDRAYDYVSRKNETAKEEYSSVDSRYQIELREIERVKHEIREEKRKLESLSDTSDTTSIEVKRKRILQLQKRMEEKKNKLASLIDGWRKREREIERDEKGQIEVVNFLNKAKEETLVRLTSLKSAMESFAICPSCGAEFNTHNNDGLSKKKLAKKIKGNETRLESIKEQIKKEEEEHEKAYQAHNVKAKIVNSDVEDSNRIIDNFAREIESEKRDIAVLEAKLSTRSNEIKNRISQLNVDLVKRMRNIVELKEQRNKLRKVLYLSSRFKVHFGKEGFKNYLFGRKIKLLQGVVNEVLQQTRVNMQVEIEGMTKLKSGKYRQKISGKAIVGGKRRDFIRLSKGEKRRIDLAFILAFGRLLNTKAPLLFRMFDEPFSGLDSRGKKRVIEMFSNLDFPVYTFAPEEALGEYYLEQNVHVVRKENAISSLVS